MNKILIALIIGVLLLSTSIIAVWISMVQIDYNDYSHHNEEYFEPIEHSATKERLALVKSMCNGEIELVPQTIFRNDTHKLGSNNCEWKVYPQGEVMKFPDVLHETMPEIVGTAETSLENKTDTILLEEKGPIGGGCESLGLEKYPPNKLEEFLNSPYQKDTTKMNFTISDFDEIPLYKELIVRNQNAEYPLNDRVRFEVNFEEYQQIRSYLEHREHTQFWNYDHIVQDELGKHNEDGHYRHPEILIDGKLHGINGLNFSPLIAGEPIDLNIQQSWTLKEAQEYYHNKERKHSALVYFEIEDRDKEPLKILLDEIKKIGTYEERLRDRMSVSPGEQNQAIDFFKKQNDLQFNNDDSKHTRFFFVDGIMYEYSFVVC